MTAQIARLLVDWNGQIIPNQYYDVVTNRFKVSEGGTGISVGGTAVSSSNPLPVQNVSASPVDRSSTITTGGTAQTVMAANTSRKGYFFQNISTETMWGSFLGNAAADTAGSFEIAPKAVISSGSVCETNALSVVSATTGRKFTAWEM